MFVLEVYIKAEIPLYNFQISDSDSYESVEPRTAPGGSTGVTQQQTSPRISYQNVGANRTIDYQRANQRAKYPQEVPMKVSKVIMLKVDIKPASLRSMCL